MWTRCSAGQTWSDETCEGGLARLTWDEAKAHAEALNASGELFFNDWRVPSLSELAQIAERQCQDPRINLEVFPTTPPSFYWSTSTRPAEGFESFAYALSFGPEGAQLLPKSEPSGVRLVRNGP